MGRLIRVLWLCIAWLIAILSGASFFYGIENGLRELSFLSAGLALAAFAASLVPLSSGFDSSFGVEGPRRATANPPPPVASGPGPPRATFPTQGALHKPDAVPILHQAGSPIGAAQQCIHCDKVLADASLGARPWASSVWVVEVDGKMRSIGPPEAEAIDAKACNSLAAVPPQSQPLDARRTDASVSTEGREFPEAWGAS